LRANLFISLLFPAVFALAQPCSLTLTGKVVTDEGERLAGAVIVLNDSLSTITKPDGSFYFNKLCAGSYVLRVRFLGYQPLKTEVSLPTEAALELKLQAEKILLQEVLIHDHFDNQPQQGTFQVVTGSLLEQNRGMPLGEMLRNAAGISTLQTGPALFKPVVHGLHSQRLLLINNGVRHESQQWGAEHAPEIDPNIASGIVIIKDASGLKYGPEGIGGVLLINPAPLPEQAGWGGEVFQALQSNGRGGSLALMAEGGSRKVEGLGWRAQTSLKRLGDFQTPHYLLSNTGVREYNFSLAAGMHRNNQGWDAYFSHFQAELGILKGTSTSSLEDLRTAMNREPPQYTGPFTYDIENPRQQTTHNLLKLQAHRHVHRGDLRLQYAFQQNNRKEFDLRRQSLNDFPALHLDLFTHTLDASWKQHPQRHLRSEVGINLMYQANNNVAGTLRTPFIPNFTQLGVGLFYLAEASLNHWTLEASLRQDLRSYDVAGFDFANRPFADQFYIAGTAFSIGAHRPLNQHLTFTSVLGSTWRPPHVSELYSAGVHQSVAAIEYGLLLKRTSIGMVPFNEYRFRPERSWKYTSSFVWQYPTLKADLTLYGNFISNYTFLQPEGVTRNVRGIYPYLRYTQTNALLTGLDAYTTWQAPGNLSLSSQVTLIRAEDVARRNYLIYIPANRYSFITSWHKNLRGGSTRLLLGLLATYTDRQRRAPRVITINQILDAYDQGTDPLQGSAEIFDFMPAPKGYFLLGAEAGCSLNNQNSKIDIYLRADNLLNHAYRDYTNRLRYYALETGRNFRISVRYSF
jgi:iron complex outermembrane receptor protein